MSPAQPYGLWSSPITPASLATARRLNALAWDTASERLVWLEGRSDRGVLVCAPADGDAPVDLTAELTVRARVGYGGGDMTAASGRAWFSSGGRLYRQPLDVGQTQAITPAWGDAASPTVSPDGRWVRPYVTVEGCDCLAIVDTEGALWPQRLATGADFYMQPAWSPAGDRVAWVQWNHPLMPWDGAELHLAHLSAPPTGGLPALADEQVIAGSADVSVLQPTFSPDGRWLAYVSDEAGWYGLYLYDLAKGTAHPLVSGSFELGQPAWSQGMVSFAWAPDNRVIYYVRSENGFSQVWSVEIGTSQASPVAALKEYTQITQLAVSITGTLAIIASKPTAPARLVTWRPGDAKAHILMRTQTESLPGALLSTPETITWTAEDGSAVHGLLYRPQGTPASALERPPLIVSVHGGPTGQTMAGYDDRAQFFSTRGYAVLQVNYRGSSGYGRVYRNALREQWGIYDVADAVSGAHYLADTGVADDSRMVIMGGSAGGYTVLQALVHHPGVFKAGICLYGVTNLFTLAADTHKLEAHYLDSMIGPLPETAERYRERSPLFSAGRIRDAVAVYQGEEDRVVPLAQAETLVAALRRSGVPHIYDRYPGEGHGWRKAETIAAFYQSVLDFLKEYVLYA